MANNIEQLIIQYSVQDVIQILENEPVQPDLIGQITAVQLLNRISMAHLSIERAMKFLIRKAGGPLVEDHHLGKRLRELTEHDPILAELLRCAFGEAVKHYQYNPNAPNMKHLQSLEAYFNLVGSNKAFQDLRYWELSQSMNDVMLRQIYLSLHLEILRAIYELLFVHNRFRTVADRVEWAVDDAMSSNTDLAYSPGTDKENSVRSYFEWLSGYSSRGEALADAVRNNFDFGDPFMTEVIRSAYHMLLKSADPAVSYFARSLDVLPPQPREVIPPVEWLGEERYQRGIVSTPSGENLGVIERGPDGLWYVTPFRPGLVMISAKAESQTDARSYLATLLTEEIEIVIKGRKCALRIVGGGHRFFAREDDRSSKFKRGDAEETAWTYKIAFWDDEHGIELGDRVEAKAPQKEQEALVHMLSGTVTEVAGHQVSLVGADRFVVEKGDTD